MNTSTEIIIPTFYRDRECIRAAQSALLQTVRCKVTVIDNGEMEHRDLPDGINYQWCGREDHAALSWYDAIHKSECKYIALLFDDDYYQEDFIEQCHCLMEEGVGYVFSNANIHYPDGKIKPNLKTLGDDETGYLMASTMEHTLLNMPLTITPACVLFRREDLLRNLFVNFTWERGGPIGPDLLLMLLPLLKYPMVGYISDKLVNLTAHEDSTTIKYLDKPGGFDDLRKRYDAARCLYLSIKQLHSQLDRSEFWIL